MHVLGLVRTFRFSTGRARAQLGTLIISPVLTGQSNDQEHCDYTRWSVAVTKQSCMHSDLQWTIIALFLLYCRPKCRHNRLQWVHPIIKKREEFGAFYTLFCELWDDTNKFFNYFRMSVSSFDELHRRLKESLQRHNSKMRNCIQPVEMLAVAAR